MRIPKKLILPLIVMAILAAGAGVIYLKPARVTADLEKNTGQKEVPEEVVTYRFGIPLYEFDVLDKTIKSGQTLSSILSAHHVANDLIYQLVQKAEGVFDLRRMQVGKPYSVFCTKDETGQAKCMVYEPDPSYFVVFDLRREPDVYKVEKEVKVRERSAGGVIESSLYQAVDDAGMDVNVSAQLYDVYKWSVDFFALQKGDEFKVILDEHYVDTTVVEIGRIKAAYFKTGNKELYAFNYEWDGHKGYYDAEGMSLKSRFLQAPLEFTRISSKYNLKRMHPVQKRVKPHLGTDYAAPTGTPIVSVADGVVVTASYTSGNGNFVKIQHDQTYTTQYLHMSKFAKGIKKGVRVSQGEVIGYVGSTGLATGPHLCYRFWKNGKQVDPFKEQPQATEPLPDKYKDDFIQKTAPLRKQLEQIRNDRNSL